MESLQDRFHAIERAVSHAQAYRERLNDEITKLPGDLGRLSDSVEGM
ncbi:hypothetical protein [Mycobacterium uberis]|nr:hypothetical protein [Mycobacterium uberis]